MAGQPTVNQLDRLHFRKRGSGFPRRVALRLLSAGKSSHGHVFLHHGAFLQLVPDGVRMIGTGCLEKLLEMISEQSCLALDITFGSGDELLVRVADILVIVTRLTTGGDCDPSRSPLWPPLVTSGTPSCSLVSCLGYLPRPPLGATFLLFCMKTAPTASSPEACLVAMSRSSFMVFGWSRPKLCTRVRQFVPDQNAEMTLALQILRSL
jgi:hypothetical protein